VNICQHAQSKEKWVKKYSFTYIISKRVVISMEN